MIHVGNGSFHSEFAPHILVLIFEAKAIPWGHVIVICSNCWNLVNDFEEISLPDSGWNMQILSTKRTMYMYVGAARGKSTLIGL